MWADIDKKIQVHKNYVSEHFYIIIKKCEESFQCYTVEYKNQGNTCAVKS